MKSKSCNYTIWVTTILLLSRLGAGAQSSSYSNTIATLNPAGYWPMHEVAAPAAGDIETNYGSLGLLGTGFYPDYQVNNGAFLKQVPGALANDGDTSVYFTSPASAGGATNSLYVPHTSPLSTLNPPFSLECWFMATNIGAGQGDILSQADGSKLQGLRLYYQNSANDPVNLLTYNGVNSGQVNFTTASFPSNTWHHIVLTCDAATNFSTWWDGAKVGGPTSLVGKYKPENHQPFTVGNGLGNARAFHGLIDEVAVYTNVIADINQHYNDGISGSAGQYFNDVTNDHPVIYLRMDSGAFTSPDPSTWPALVNYGLTNGVGTSNGVYTPGTMPGVVAGGAYQSFPVGLIGPNVAQLSGVSSYADAGSAAAYNPAGTTPFSVSAIFRGNPTDTNRVQSIVGHGTNSWELGLTVGGSIVFNSGTNSAAVVATGSAAGDFTSTTAAYDDGAWHQVVAVHNNTTNILYVDGVANNTNIVASDSVGNSLDMMIGSDPCYTNNPIGLGRQFAGQVCEVAFFTNALAASDIQTLYNQSGLLPVISVQPVSGAVSAGTAFTNRVTVSSGSTPLSYQWYENGAPRSGATNVNLVINPVLPADGSTNYYFVASNSFGATTSAVASLTVYSTPTLTAQYPITITNPITLFGGTSPSTRGSTPTFSVAVVGGQPLTYRWTTNGTTVTGATSSSFTFTNCQMNSPTAFACVMSNSYGLLTNRWTVTYTAAPTAPYPQLVLADQPITYWRLNEPDDGLFDGNPNAICNDYQSGNNGTYTNVYLSNATLGTGYSPATDPGERAAEFGIYNGSACFAGSIGSSNLDFSATSNAEFTIAIWANGNSTTQPGNAGLVTKGFFNGEEFTIDEGASGSALRFGIRASVSPNTFYGANSSVKLGNDSNWHFVVGVCDETNNTVSLYVDGQLAATNHLPANSGLITTSAAVPIMIGARSSSAGTPGNNQFKGLLNDAAIFNYAMTSSQIVALFQAAGVPPTFVQQPASTNVSYGDVLRIPSVVSGSTPLRYQWYEANLNTLLTGQTNATLVISNYTTSDSYYLTVSNAFGVTNSPTVTASVVSGGPQVFTDVKNPFYGIEGRATSNTVTAYGTAPLTYQWQIWNGASWVNLADNGRITGSQTATLNIASAIPSDANLYQVIISNSISTATSGPGQLIIAGVPINFYTNGLFWTSNGSARISSGLLSLTDPANGGGTGSFFYQVPQYIGAFAATFTYQAGGNRAADGMSFCLQNDSRGVSALGGGGGQLGVGGTTGNQITPSVELMLDIFGGSGFAMGTNGTNFPNAGANSANFSPAGSVAFNSGDPIDVTLLYYGGYLELTFNDSVTSNSFTTNLHVGDITSVLGTNTAYVGFTGSYGGSTSVQTITNFSFVSLATQSINVSGGNVTISWPGPIVGYQLLQNANVGSTNWTAVTNADNVTNGQHQVVMPLNNPYLFYRLKLLQ
jgi:prepilin-type processing-associated H-X9-DG protein